ncbi:hypothetical protein [Streptomyces sp. NPDC086182]|uniref:hypothetical protein n=1 Tax=Streptomyces sp. NPDC086182 TaxID=3155058 RepID=UPI003427F453
MTDCKAEACGRRPIAKGLCDKHYRRTRKRADGSYEDRRKCLYGATPAERYENFVDRSVGPDACHPWLGAEDNGYGLFWDGGYTGGGNPRNVKAHAWGYRQRVGELASNEVVRHLCHNKLCQNERHWARGTALDNTHDSIAAGMVVAQRKLTAHKVAEIRSRYAAGGITQKLLAAEYGITQTHLNDVVNCRVWKHVAPASERVA